MKDLSTVIGLSRELYDATMKLNLGKSKFSKEEMYRCTARTCDSRPDLDLREREVFQLWHRQCARASLAVAI